MAKLTEAQIETALRAVPEWGESGDAIQRTYQFPDFVKAMLFVDQVAQAAEANQHHPDILIRYSKVTLTLSTHDAGGITAKDFELAKKCDLYFSAVAPPPPSPAAAAPPSGKRRKA
ncbi:MAG: 4a-hydroxytetrahydrobiopterin dehydratase [Phycisphaerales bacterium]|nr:4a-hydroxytetrahydrobiopterin dehydratase [Planctomycetota bacterium]